MGEGSVSAVVGDHAVRHKGGQPDKGQVHAEVAVCGGAVEAEEDAWRGYWRVSLKMRATSNLSLGRGKP